MPKVDAKRIPNKSNSHCAPEILASKASQLLYQAEFRLRVPKEASTLGFETQKEIKTIFANLPPAQIGIKACGTAH